jgi:signal peptidase I
LADFDLKPESGDESGGETRGQGTAASCYEWVEGLIISLIIVMFLFVFIFRGNIVVIGDSMKPNYQSGNRLLISCLDRSYKRGDVVVIEAGGTKLDDRIIKRVIATQGQTVDIDFTKGVISVDGKELDESEYIENGITKNRYDVDFPEKVPEGCVFVLGDNRPISEDSRSSYVSMVDTRHIIGKVIYMLFPFKRPV